MKIYKTKILGPASLKSMLAQAVEPTLMTKKHTNKPILQVALPKSMPKLAPSPQSQKYLYYEAHYGFNDILSAILRLITYCDKHNRTLLINMANSTYQINFADYFTLPQKNIVTDSKMIYNICNNNTSIYPKEFATYMNEVLNGSYTSQVKTIRLNELPQEERSETIIIHTHGKNGDGFQLFQHMKLCPAIIEICQARYDVVQKPYIALQVRNTDYQSDYKALYYNNAARIHSFKSVFLATDDESVLKFFKSKSLVIYNFTTFNSAAHCKNLHYNTTISGRTKIFDLMTDIYIVAMSTCMLSNSKGGFIDLIKSCFNNKKKVTEIFKKDD